MKKLVSKIKEKLSSLKKKERKFNIKEWLIDNAIFLVILFIIIFTGVNHPRFFTVRNAMNILSNASVRFIIALGVSGALITRGTDLSAGRLVGLSAIISATLSQRVDFAGKFWPNLPDLPVLLPLLIAVTVTTFFGFLNGMVVAHLQVPPFLATLGMQIIVFGVNIIYSRGEPIGTFKQSYLNVAQGRLFDTVPYVVVYALIAGILMWILYTKTRHGKYMYAIGGNENAAEVSGINVKKSKVKIYALAGFLYGVAGFLLSSRATSASPNSGMGYELEAIASATIGGVSTAGGEGSVPGIFLGVFIFELLKTSLTFLGVKPETNYIIQGLVIIVAVALDIRKTLEQR